MSAAIEVPDAHREATAIVEVAIELRAVPTILRRTTTAERGGLGILARAAAPEPVVEVVDGWAMLGPDGLEQLFELGEHPRLFARGLEAEKGAHALMAMSMRFSTRRSRRSRASRKGKRR